MILPTAHQVAIAIVTACRIEDEDPIAVASGEQFSSTARAYALEGLIEVFGQVGRRPLWRMVGGRSKQIYVGRRRVPKGAYLYGRTSFPLKPDKVRKVVGPLTALPPSPLWVPDRVHKAPPPRRQHATSAPCWLDAPGRAAVGEFISEKARMRAILEEAARNTARLQAETIQSDTDRE